MTREREMAAYVVGTIKGVLEQYGHPVVMLSESRVG